MMPYPSSAGAGFDDPLKGCALGANSQIEWLRLTELRPLGARLEKMKRRRFACSGTLSFCTLSLMPCPKDTDRRPDSRN